LFYESFSNKYKGIDESCYNQSAYLLMGINQNINDHRNLGYLVILAFALEIPIDKLFHETLSKIKAEESKFRMILEGKIYKYFTNFKDFMNLVYKNFISNKPWDIEYAAEFTNEVKVPWNDIFMDIAYYYFNINTIVFLD